MGIFKIYDKHIDQVTKSLLSCRYLATDHSEKIFYMKEEYTYEFRLGLYQPSIELFEWYKQNLTKFLQTVCNELYIDISTDEISSIIEKSTESFRNEVDPPKKCCTSLSFSHKTYILTIFLPVLYYVVKSI
jgi:hypothetical protein